MFDWLQRSGNIEDLEMYGTFNCGIGMTLCVAAGDVDRALEILAAQGETASVIGEVRHGDRGVVFAG